VAHRAACGSARACGSEEGDLFLPFPRVCTRGYLSFGPAGLGSRCPPISTARIEPATKSRNSPGDYSYKNSSTGRRKNSARPFAWSLLMARLPGYCEIPRLQAALRQ